MITTPAQDGVTPQTPARWGTVWVEVVLTLAALGALWHAVGLNETARRFPVIVLAVVLALLLLDITTEVVPSLRRRKTVMERGLVEAPDDLVTATQEDPEDDEEPADGRQPDRAHNEWIILGWLAALALAITFLGYRVGAPLFIVAFSLYAKVPVRVWVASAVAMALLCHYVLYDIFGLR